jgi:hypothetical protein
VRIAQKRAKSRSRCSIEALESSCNRNAKIMRRVVRAAYLGLPPGDTTALENPAAVAEIAVLGQQRAPGTVGS